MPDLDSSDELPLPGGDSDDALFERLEEPEAREEMVRRAAADDARIRIAIAHRLRREIRLLDRYNEEERVLHEQYAAATRPISQRIANLEAVMNGIALRYREAGYGTSMVVPGVGTWSTRKKPARWEVSNDAAIALLRPDEVAYSTYVDPGQPKPAEPKLRGQPFRKLLDELLDTALAGRGDVTAEERAEIAKVVAAAYPGAVGYVPETIDVDWEAAHE